MIAARCRRITSLRWHLYSLWIATAAFRRLLRSRASSMALSSVAAYSNNSCRNLSTYILSCIPRKQRCTWVADWCHRRRMCSCARS
ncbi:hypothetical protein PF002_g5517 [Phytophthora fragariae]|uniref:Secreted protein n=1 Tax=Phytophthora fragariae TaxID=53985 RepID=A0A6A4A679_9STRA|nr:hypothetical protein PF002_g5517 [Phytophthora fragariae]